MPNWQPWFVVGLLVLWLSGVVWSGYHSWKLLAHEEIVITKKSLWFTVLVGTLALFVVPFGSSDSNYYFAAGKSVS